MWLTLENNIHIVSWLHETDPWWRHLMGYFPRYWYFVQGIHRSPVNSPNKGQWRGAFVFSLICAWINRWVNNREAGDLRRHRVHYDVIVMSQLTLLSIFHTHSLYKYPPPILVFVLVSYLSYLSYCLPVVYMITAWCWLNGNVICRTWYMQGADLWWQDIQLILSMPNDNNLLNDNN